VPARTEDIPPSPEGPEKIPLIHNTRDRPDTSVSNTVERARRDRKPPKYLADYYIGCLSNPKFSKCSLETNTNSIYNLGTVRNCSKTERIQNRYLEEDRCPELPTLTDQLTGHVTGDFGNFKIKIKNSAILSTASRENRRVSNLEKKSKRR